MNDNNVLKTPEKENKKKKLSGLDLAAKIMAVIVAFVIWIYAVNSEGTTFEKTVSSVSVKIENMPAGFTIISGSGYTVDVKVNGKRSDILALKASDITAYVDASSCIESGLSTLPVLVNLPSGISLSEVYPSSISVYFGVTTSKQLPITISLKNFTLENDYTIEKSTPELSAVTLTGPSDELEKVTEARVTLEPGNIRSSFTASGKIVLYDANGNIYSNPYVTCSASDVLVRIDVQTFKTVPLYVDYRYGYFSDKNVSVQIEPAAIRLKGSTDDLAKIESLRAAVIDETSLPEGSVNTMPVNIDFPENVTSADGKSSVMITVNHIGSATQHFTVGNINLINTADNRTYTLVNESVNVAVRGDIGEYFNYFSAEDIEIVLDMKDYNDITDKVITVPAKIVINNESDSVIYALGSYSVSLTIE